MTEWEPAAQKCRNYIMKTLSLVSPLQAPGTVSMYLMMRMIRTQPLLASDSTGIPTASHQDGCISEQCDLPSRPPVPV